MPDGVWIPISAPGSAWGRGRPVASGSVIRSRAHGCSDGGSIESGSTHHSGTTPPDHGSTTWAATDDQGRHAGSLAAGSDDADPVVGEDDGLDGHRIVAHGIEAGSRLVERGAVRAGASAR